MNGKIVRNVMVSLFLSLTIADAVWVFNAESVETQPATATVGKPAPDFKLTDSNGKARSLSDFKGKFVVLEWVNFDCPFVKKHYESNNMQKLQKEFTGKKVAWLSINSSAKGKQGNFAPADINAKIKERKASPTAYLIDEDGTVGRLYGAKSTPHMFVIDSKGVLVYAGAIDDNNSADAADAAKAKNYVREALNASMKGKPVAEASTKAYGCGVKYAK
jgi:peroxiredoxin